MEGSRENNDSSVEKDSTSMKSKEASEKNIDSMSLQSEVATDDDIPTLTEENYRSWKDKMEKLLKYKEVWDYLVGAKREPDDQSNEDWKQKKEEIVSIFEKKCGARTVPYIEGLENMSLIWSQLVTMYEFKYSTSNTVRRKQRTHHTWCVPLYTAISDGDWKSVSELVSENEGALTARLTSGGDLPLHVAVQQQRTEIAKELIKMMPAHHLSRQGKDAITVLHIAAVCGNKEVIKAMIEKDENLVMIKSKYYHNRIPIMMAAIFGHKDAVNYLYPITIRQTEEVGHHDHQMEEDHSTDQERETTTIKLLTTLIFGEFYGQALDLLQKYQGLVLVKDVDNWTPMEALSEMPTSFKSSLPSKRSVGRLLGYYFMYSLLDVQVNVKNASCHHTKRGDEENSFDEDDDANGNSTQAGNMTSRSRTNSIIFQFVKGLLFLFRWLFQNALIKLVPGCKNIYEEKLKHDRASELLKQMWRIVSKLDDLTSVNKAVGLAMSNATRNGIVEFIEECINYCPQLLKTSRTLVFHDAIKYRQEKIFGLIHRLGPMKNDLTTVQYIDSGDFMSHTAAQKAPIERLNQVPGAALQMQRELLWYKVHIF
ncbi:uncharacterized protein LOC122076677 [Macadamia integrifolia]|uniref:uncharacterized protein LOC122076677 n=1 Tax=Macadamia integrifolia TaxID=60698 RepID=UPI001C4EDE47|nr:uncharacterized protein LOC122076677 [Macadamia integrifolia]